MKIEELNPRIRIKSPLRCDGIGRLDCAEDTDSGARLAVRWLPLDANGDAAVRACAKLPEHPTLPRVRQTGQVGDKAFLAMEFPDGNLLATLIGDALGGDLLLEMGAQLADALAMVHSQGVVHGEMSAESVLLARGKAYLWDMPLVIANRLTDRRGEERLMHQLVRTAPFLSPERARGGAPAPEGDVYALAAIICIAGGAKPPPHGTTLSVVHAVVNGEWVPEVPALFRAPYRGLLERMLSRDGAKRPTAREVADLLGKPAAAIPTIPEMPAIVLQRPSGPLLVAPPVLRPVPKNPYASAPGALEPMLPPKAVADAAAKVPSKPLPITVPTQVESTLKVNVPVQVLVAMSQPVRVDSELKAVIEAMQPVVAAAAIPTIPVTKTLEFGKTSLSPEVGEGRGEGAVERRTPSPAIAATIAEVKAALEKKALTPPPLMAPTVAEVQAAITAPNPPPIPRRESREIPPPPMVAEAPKPAAVEVHENVCVSAETYAAGAGVLSDEDADALEVLPRSKPTFLIAAALLAVVTTGLAVGARALVTHDARPTPVAARPVVVTPPPVTEPQKPVVAVEQEEDELSPLPAAPKKAWRPVKRSASPSKLQGKYDSHSEPQPTTADDFSFLDSTAEAPKEELKRPAF